MGPISAKKRPKWGFRPFSCSKFIRSCRFCILWKVPPHRLYRHYSAYIDRRYLSIFVDICRIFFLNVDLDVDFSRYMSISVDIGCRFWSICVDICRKMSISVSILVDTCRYMSKKVDICRYLCRFWSICVDICRKMSISVSILVDMCRYMSIYVEKCRKMSISAIIFPEG